MLWTRMVFLGLWICLIISGQSAANNLHDQMIRTAVAPMIDDEIKNEVSAKSHAGLHLSLIESKDLPAKITYRIVPVESQPPKARDGKGPALLEPGLYELIVSVDQRETFRRKFQAFPDLHSNLRLSYTKESGFALEQSIELPQVKFQKSRKGVLKESYPILEFVAALMHDEETIQTLSVLVHTDSGGKEASNIKLTQDRADEITKFLKKKGVDPKRLMALGMGSSRPLVPNTSRANRLLNRRVEYVLETVQDKVLIGKTQ
ncbi:OmpA family protein [Oligoflexus tunisiensis]|uniref:OmpA family protein n=1 Tax=Oligoflexus tunisiensis TaxID=708132 RepID=UPI00114C861A|nr:OmpA family protein [Oligoflexus tunisiensis]